MNEPVVILLVAAIVVCAIKWRESIKREKQEMDIAVEQEGMIYMERLAKERAARNKKETNHAV